MPPGFEPKSGSVSAKQPIASPRPSAGSHRAFCSSEPNRWIANMRQRALNGHERPQGAVAALELLHHQPVCDGAESRQPVPGEVRAQQAEVGQPGHQLAREPPLPGGRVDHGITS